MTRQKNGYRRKVLESLVNGDAVTAVTAVTGGLDGHDARACVGACVGACVCVDRVSGYSGYSGYTSENNASEKRETAVTTFPRVTTENGYSGYTLANLRAEAESGYGQLHTDPADIALILAATVATVRRMPCRVTLRLNGWVYVTNNASTHATLVALRPADWREAFPPNEAHPDVLDFDELLGAADLDENATIATVLDVVGKRVVSVEMHAPTPGAPVRVGAPLTDRPSLEAALRLPVRAIAWLPARLTYRFQRPDGTPVVWTSHPGVYGALTGPQGAAGTGGAQTAAFSPKEFEAAVSAGESGVATERHFAAWVTLKLTTPGWRLGAEEALRWTPRGRVAGFGWWPGSEWCDAHDVERERGWTVGYAAAVFGLTPVSVEVHPAEPVQEVAHAAA